MKIKYEARFERDLGKIQKPILLKRIKEFISIIKASDSTFDIPQIKKLKGHNSYYRIKFGNYRIGFEIANDVLILTRILHRKDIYRHFP